MAKFILIWDAGFGKNASVEDCMNEEEALEAAYEMAREHFEAHSDFQAVPLTKESAKEYGVEFEEDESPAAQSETPA